MSYFSFSLSSLPTLAARIAALRGLRRLAFLFAVGAAMSFAMPPYNLFPLLWLGLPLMIWSLRGARSGLEAFLLGWTGAFGFLTASLYWTAASMFVDLAHFWWAVPLAVAGLPALFALYYALTAWCAFKIGLDGLAGALTFGLFWFAGDVMRGTLFTGFPWNILGYAWSGVLPVLQITSLIGIYGLSLITSMAAAAPAALADEPQGGKRSLLISLLFFAACGAWGEARLLHTKVADTPGVLLRLVQPNIPQEQKWRIGSRARDFKTLLDLTAQPAAPMPTHVIWPETASTYYLSEDDFHRKAIAEVIPASSAVLTGVIRRALNPDGSTSFYNSLVAVDGLGRLVAGYDKAHLVPFGEFMPLGKYLPLKAVAASDEDFSAGPGPRTLRVLGLPTFSPLICYESIFSGQVVNPDDRPDFILNITNDAWYGDTIGPYQHFAIARVRAIEEGLPLVRVANTGISGVFDPLGRIKNELPLNERGVIDAPLPQPLSLTFFGKWSVIPCAAMAFALAVWTRSLRKKRKDGNKKQEISPHT